MIFHLEFFPTHTMFAMSGVIILYCKQDTFISNLFPQSWCFRLKIFTVLIVTTHVFGLKNLPPFHLWSLHWWSHCKPVLLTYWHWRVTYQKQFYFKTIFFCKWFDWGKQEYYNLSHWYKMTVPGDQRAYMKYIWYEIWIVLVQNLSNKKEEKDIRKWESEWDKKKWKQIGSIKVFDQEAVARGERTHSHSTL